MCNNSSSEVCRLNFVTWEGGRPWNEENEETLFPVIYLGRAAENDVGQETSDHDMRKMRRPYDQSSILGGPASQKVEPGDDGHLLLAGPPKILDWSMVIGVPFFPQVLDTNFLTNLIFGGPAQIT